MGQDKATLPYKDKRLADVVADVVWQAGIAKIYVSGELEGYDSLPDLLAERGPVGEYVPVRCVFIKHIPMCFLFPWICPM